MTCRHGSCGRGVHLLGYCITHYNRDRQGLDMDAPLRVPKGSFEQCLEPGCDRPYRARGYCKGHYQKARMSHNPLTIPSWLQPGASHRSKHGNSPAIISDFRQGALLILARPSCRGMLRIGTWGNCGGRRRDTFAYSAVKMLTIGHMTGRTPTKC